MNVGVVKETREGERRVGLVPDAVRRLAGTKLEVLVEAGAGAPAGYADADYRKAGARLVAAEEAWGAAIVVKVERPLPAEVSRLQRGAVLVAMLQHLADRATAEALAARGVTAFAMDWMPRSTRAQDMDARSSMSTVAGYKAALVAADLLPRMMPMLMTAAGTVAPAHVLVIGAGVAGLSAIATARRLGAVVEGFDVRPATREQVESLGARFLAMEQVVEGAQDAQGYAVAQAEAVLEAERRTLAGRLPQVDVVISTALIPGQRPPLLLTGAMVETMRPGSVIVDLAAIAGGNCEVTRPGELVLHAGVQVVGWTDLESRVAYHASQLYARNVATFLQHLVRDGALRLDLEDELVRFPMVSHDGKLTASYGGA